jgi:1-deoxy-D-xylulose-5-phosphate synthase
MVRQIHTAKSGIKQLIVPGMYFEEMGITYLGPVDGSNIKEMKKFFAEAKRVRGLVLVHVLTHKGKGYAPAERHPARFHGTEAFDVETGKPLVKKTRASYTDVFSSVMAKMGESDERLVAITAAMEDGTGLKRFHNLYPDRFFDVGIAEEHAVTFAAGLAKSGMKPVFAVYSSFLQRGYDQLLHDVCAQNLPVVFAVDRAGLVGKDGVTHQGIFDLSYLTSVPGLCVMAPKNKWELSDMLKFAVNADVPVAIRYPRGDAPEVCRDKRAPIRMGCAEILSGGSDIVLLAIGSMVETAWEVREKLREQEIEPTVVNARFASPIDVEAVRVLAKTHKLVVTMEENVLSGGFGEHVAAIIAEEKLDVEILRIAIPDRFVEHGCVPKLKEELRIDANSVFDRILERFGEIEV